MNADKRISKESVTLVRVYTDEGDCNISHIMENLHHRGDVVGATIFRGISGFGDQGHVHQASLMDLTTRLPIVIEFYHKDEKSDELIAFMHTQIRNAHIVSWKVDLSFETVK